MSYSGHRRRGMGAFLAPTGNAPPTGLPEWGASVYYEQNSEHGEDWGKIGGQGPGMESNGGDRVLTAIQTALQRVRAMPTGVGQPRVGRGGGYWVLPENGHFIEGLRNFWVRMGRINEQWPGARNEFNFGPNIDNAKDLRISRRLYEWLRTPPGLWRIQHDGYVRLRKSDPLYSEDVLNKLKLAGYVPRDAIADVKDDSVMLGGLRRWFDEAQAMGRDVGLWPSGFDFGPNTAGDEVRVSNELLTNILTGRSPKRENDERKTVEALKSIEIRPAIMGMLTNIGGKNRTKPIGMARAGTYAPTAILNQFVMIPPKK